MPGPGLRGHGRCALERFGLPAAEVREDLAHRDWVIDQRDHAHRPAFYTSALRAFERIGIIDLADEPRPGSLGALRELILGNEIVEAVEDVRVAVDRAWRQRALRVAQPGVGPQDVGTAHSMNVVMAVKEDW